MKEETLNKIDRYLRGEMTEREKNAFENILAGDDALRQRVELMKDIIDAVETRAMKEHLVALDVVRSKRNQVYKIGRIVSVLAACLVLAVFFFHVGDDHLSIPVTIPSDLGMYQRGGTHTRNVVKLLNDSQYDEALILVDSLRIVYRSEDSLVLAKKIKTEEDVYIHECDSIVLYQLEWLRIQSLIGQKKYNEVRESLEQYRLQEGDYRDKADSLWMLLR